MHNINPSTGGGGWRQNGQKSEASLAYMRPYLKQTYKIITTAISFGVASLKASKKNYPVVMVRTCPSAPATTVSWIPGYRHGDLVDEPLCLMD